VAAVQLERWADLELGRNHLPGPSRSGPAIQVGALASPEDLVNDPPRGRYQGAMGGGGGGGGGGIAALVAASAA